MEKKRTKGRQAKKTINKPLWIVIGSLSVLLVIGLVILFVHSGQKEPAPEQTLTPVVFPQSSEPTTVPAESTTLPTEAEQTDLTEAETTEVTEPDETEPVTPPTEPPKPAKPTTPKDPDRQIITFPYVIPGSNLVIEYINSYSGVFMEDGSDREVENISAMVITNLGNTQVEYAKIDIYCDEDLLTFDLSGLPAGATIVVQESEATPYSDGEYHDCSFEVAELESFEMSEEQVLVEENEYGLLVTNLTDETIPTIRIFYKFYMFDENVYVCGITYTAKIQNLEGNASCVVTPSHYAPGSSQIIMVRTYDTEN